jgi:hypothetical protein
VTESLSADADSTVSPLPEDELAALRRLLQRSRGFTLAFVRSNTPLDTRRILEELDNALATDEIRIRRLRLTGPEVDLYGWLTGLQPMLAALEVAVREALHDAERLRIPEADQIRSVLGEHSSPE